VTIFDSLRKKRTIPDPEAETNHNINTREFLGATFSPINEKEHLITLSGDPDWEIILWKWDTFKLLGRISLNVTCADPNPGQFQVSAMKIGAELKVAVTGTDTFRYLSITPGDHKISMISSELGARDGRDDHEVSTDYTCHVWTKDTNQLLVCTAAGDMLLCNHGGEFIRYIPDSGMNIMRHRIDSITAYSRGVIAAGEHGLIWAFEGSTSDEAPYKLQQDPIDSKKRDDSVCKYIETENINIVSVILNNTEDTLYYIDRQNQLLKYAIQLDGTDIETEKS